MTAPVTKLSVLQAHMARGEWSAAIKLAASFGRLGAEKAAIMRGREALLRPAFQLSLGRCPAELIEHAKAALERRYGGGNG